MVQRQEAGVLARAVSSSSDWPEPLRQRALARLRSEEGVQEVLCIATADAPHVIGARHANLNRLQRESGASIVAPPPPPRNRAGGIRHGRLVTVDALFGTAVAQLEGADSPVPARAARTARKARYSAPRAVAKHGGGRATVAQRMRAMHQIRQPSKVS